MRYVFGVLAVMTLGSATVEEQVIPGPLLITGMRGPTQHRTEVFTNFNVAVAGGMDVPIQVSDRIAITPRFRFRTVLPLSSYRPYTRFAISPGVGVQVRF